MSGLLKKRGQFTIFVILGLVILFIFMFALFSNMQVVNTQLTVQADRQIKEYMDKNSINQYVTSCLDAVSEEVVIQAGLQGGTLNFTGKTLNQDYVEYHDAHYNRTVNVSIVIDKNSDCPENPVPGNYVVDNNPGPYPYRCGNVFLNALPFLYNSDRADCINVCSDAFNKKSGFFGINSLQILCDRTGANRIDPSFNDVTTKTCDYYDASARSLQKQLEDGIRVEIGRCINFTDILDRSPSNITQVGNVTTKIIFGNNGFRVQLQYPFTVMMFNRQPVTRMVDFISDKDIAFKELYEYSYELANTDVKDILFDVVNDRSQLLGGQGTRRSGENIYGGFMVELRRGDLGNGFIDIVTVTDFNNRLRNLPLVVNFAVKNRAPALEYIHETSSQYYDVVGVENESIILKPQGYDPDEESVRYTYSFWKEEYDDYYDYDNPKCSGDASTTIEYIIANCTKINVSAAAPHNWTNSTLFKNTGQNATYTPTGSDVGFHIVKITAEDRQWNDYQVVRILVFDTPEAKLEGSNEYDDVPDNYASYEDRYILSGADSKVGSIASSIGAGLSHFTWNDTEETFELVRQITVEADKTLKIPEGLYAVGTPIGILDIPPLIFTKKAFTSKLHNISLTVNTTMGLSDTDYFEVNVTQCLNHSSTDAPYPYNSGDPFQADHACCLDNMQYAPSTNVCFNPPPIYGLNKTLKDYRSTPSPPTHNIAYPNIPAIGWDNDIFVQTFSRKCSGDRGNTCTGEASELRYDLRQCDDTNNGVSSSWTDYERCSGPPIANINIPSNVAIACVYYGTGQTFEKLSGTGNSQTGSCTGAFKKQASGNGELFGSGKYSCFGACSSTTGACMPTDCECDRNHGSDARCSGLTSDGPVRDKSCGANNFEDRCESCGVTGDANTICRDDSYGPGCNANEACNGKSPGDKAYACVPGTPFQAKCTSNCGINEYFESIGNRVIHKQHTISGGRDGCPADVDNACNNAKENSVYDETRYCDTSGKLMTCPIGEEIIGTPNPNIGRITRPCAPV